MAESPALDHIALTVPDLPEQVERMTKNFGMIAEVQFDGFAVIADPVSGLKFELSRSEDSDVHFRHLGFRANDVDSTHAGLVEAGMEPNENPRRQDFARMYQSRLCQPGGLEIQLVKYDE